MLQAFRPVVEIRRSEDIAAAVEALTGHTDALYVCGDPLVFTNRVRVNTLTQGARLPTIYLLGESVEAGDYFPRPCIIGYDSSPSRCGPVP